MGGANMESRDTMNIFGTVLPCPWLRHKINMGSSYIHLVSLLVHLVFPFTKTPRTALLPPVLPFGEP